jgi:hypothetical protein
MVDFYQIFNPGVDMQVLNKIIKKIQGIFMKS